MTEREKRINEIVLDIHEKCDVFFGNVDIGEMAEYVFNRENRQEEEINNVIEKCGITRNAENTALIAKSIIESKRELSNKLYTSFSNDGKYFEEIKFNIEKVIKKLILDKFGVEIWEF